MAEFVIRCEADKQEALRMIADYQRRTGQSPETLETNDIDDAAAASMAKSLRDIDAEMAASPADPSNIRSGRDSSADTGLSL